MDDDLDHVFDDHPSLSASLEDFAATCNNTNHVHRPPLFDIPSQHSGFRSEESDDEDDEATAGGEPWSPPGFRRHDYVPGSGWYRHQPYLRRDDNNNDRLDLRPPSPSQSRDPSPQYEDAPEAPQAPPAGEGKNATADIADITLPANMPLPADANSPQKGRSPSPDRTARGGNGREGAEFGTDTLSNCNTTLLPVPFPRGVLTEAY